MEETSCDLVDYYHRHGCCCTMNNVMHSENSGMVPG